MKRLLFLISSSLLYLVGCVGGQPQNSSTPSLGHSVANLGTDNGFDPNGLDGNGWDGNGLDGNGIDPNGLDGNGIDPNGMDPNGLTPSGLTGAQAAAKFNGWFVNHLSQAGANSDKTMKYIAKCALPAGKSLTLTFPNVVYTSPFAPPTCTTDGVNTTCSWPGALGLAPVWSSNQAIPLYEQRAVSACLAAHINAAGETILVSFRGSGLTVDADESLQHAAPEAVFWGNIFDGTGVFMQKSTATFGTSGFVPRGCSIPSSCAPMVTNTAGWLSGQTIGTRFADGSYTTNATAWQTGVTNPPQYPAIATFLLPEYAAAHAPSGKGVLKVQVSGLPVMNGAYWANGQVSVQAAGMDYLSDFRPAFHVMSAGTYSVTAYSVNIGGINYSPTAPSSVTVSAGAPTVLSVTYY